MGEMMNIDVTFDYDKDTYRHTMNGHESVMHCHHYMSLTTKLAEQHAKAGGTTALATSAEDSIRPLMDDYFKEHGVKTPEDRLAVGCAYYAVMGLGKMKATGTTDGGNVTLERSHVDEGWVQKWGKHDRPVNHVTRGFVAAMFASTFDAPARGFAVTETASIVTGSSTSAFSVERA